MLLSKLSTKRRHINTRLTVRIDKTAERFIKMKTRHTIMEYILISFTLVTILILFVALHQGTNYSETMQVIEITKAYTILQDAKQRQIIINRVDKQIGQECLVTFNDRNTKDINDDVVKDITWLKD